MDCELTCLRMVARRYCKHLRPETIRKNLEFVIEGASLPNFSEAGEAIGLRRRGVQINFEKLQVVQMPIVLHWDQYHFVVLYSISENKVKIADPAKGKVTLDKEEFLQNRVSNRKIEADGVEIVLLLEPSLLFYENLGEKDQKSNWAILTRYLSRSKLQIFQVIASLIISSILKLTLPFLTKSMVYTGSQAIWVKLVSHFLFTSPEEYYVLLDF